METTLPISCLRKLFDQHIKKFLSAEAELQNAITNWISVDQANDLHMLLSDYQDLIKGHIERLNALLQKERITVAPIKNKVMLALIEDAADELSECRYQEVKDASVLATIQNIIHWKIGSYGSTATFANILGSEGTAFLFHEFVKEEKYFDERLTHLAKHKVNVLAIEPLSQLDDNKL